MYDEKLSSRLMLRHRNEMKKDAVCLSSHGAGHLRRLERVTKTHGSSWDSWLRSDTAYVSGTITQAVSVSSPIKSGCIATLFRGRAQRDRSRRAKKIVSVPNVVEPRHGKLNIRHGRVADTDRPVDHQTRSEEKTRPDAGLRSDG